MKPSILLHSLLAFNSLVSAETVIRIRFIDKAGVDATIRRVAAARVEQILIRAGVPSVWLDCPAPTPTAPPSCPQELTALDLIIQNLPDPGPLRLGKYKPLGASIASREGGTYASIYYPNVQRTAELLDVPVGILLALAVVHEIGHLVLGSQSHWPGGIMHRQWDRKVVANMIQMNQYFTRWQSQQLQNRLLARTLLR